MIVPGMMGIASPTGSHLPALTAAVESLPAGSLVIEHGAGLYSTPLLARYPVRVLCAENHLGWAEWARWIYSGRDCEVVDSWKRLVPTMADAAVAFIDGTPKERGDLLRLALERGVPHIVAHDTNEPDWFKYEYQPHHFKWRGYHISHIAEDTHRTTTWRRQS